MDSLLPFFLLCFTSFFTLTNPLGTMPVFLTMTNGMSEEQRRAIVRRATIVSFLTLMVFTFSGQFLFKFFGISTNGFRIAGGIIIFTIGFDMLQARYAKAKLKEEEVKTYVNDISITPLAIPMLCGPGAIANALMLMDDAVTLAKKCILIGTIGLIYFITYLILRASTRLNRYMGETGNNVTTFEMRFIALRCKDTIAPTGTIAQGVGAKQVNSLGEVYETKYGLTTSERVYGTVMENLQGRGPCYLRTEGISEEQNESLKKAYLNMAPSQTLKWLESGRKPSEQNVEIEGTEPYIVGGHTASGYWVDTNRQTTINGLYAAGDVAGGCPQKYVTGAMVEGEIAAKHIVQMLDEQESASDERSEVETLDAKLQTVVDDKITEYSHYLNNPSGMFTTEALEEAMQKVTI